MIREKFGEDAKIIYVSLTRDYTYKDSVKNICFTTWAMTTNEMKELSKEECNKLNINYNLVSVYPWENVTEELKATNQMEWVCRMNNIKNRAEEIIYNEIIYS